MKYDILYRSQIMQGHIEDYDIYTKCNGKLLKFFKIDNMIIFFFNETNCGH